MQKIYQRINWENDPSTNTPINEDNLNKMDYAIDTLDSRVVLLYGYQDRVAQSEKNAKTSETNAKESETNAKQSEIKAKEYMESAFNASQEGYEALVEKVERMDIKTTSEFELRDTKNGGYRLLEMSGATVQNGEPSPINPIAIENVGDCVEMMQGILNIDTGVYLYKTTGVCSKRPVPCKPGDVISFETGITAFTRIVYFKDGVFVSNDAPSSSGKTYSTTVPNGVNEFKFYFASTSDILLETVGKITLTVNGKYVVQIVERGKNLFDERDLLRATGCTFSNGYYTCEAGYFRTLYLNGGFPIKYKENTQYTILSTCKDSSGSTSFRVVITYSDGTSTQVIIGNSTTDKNTVYHTTKDKTVTHMTFSYGKSGTVYIKELSIQEGAIENPTYEPYTEKVATIFLDEPLRDGDRLVKIDGYWYVERVKACTVFDKNANLTVGSMNSQRVVVYAKWNGVVDLDIQKKESSLCNMLVLDSKTWDSTYLVDSYSIDSNGHWYFNFPRTLYGDSMGTLLEWLGNNPLEIISPLATPTLTPLDTESQLALNGLVTFNGTTYLEVDSKIKPSGIKGEYGTSQVGAYTLKSLLNSESNAVKIEDAINTMLLITP